MGIPEKGTLEYGAWNALSNALKVQPQERVLIITDEAMENIGQAFHRQAAELSQREPTLIFMEQFNRPLLRFPDKIGHIIKHTDVSVYVATGQKGELAFRKPYLAALEQANVRHGHGINVTEEIVLTGMQADVEACNTRCAELYERLHDKSAVLVQSPAGTNICLEFSDSIRWENSDWDISVPGKWHNIPSGEVYSAPINANGVIVVDGVLGDHFDFKYGPIRDTPITWVVKDNYVVDVHCKNPELEREFRTYIAQHEHAHRIGEFGVGALSVDKLIGKMLQDEKALGTVHIAVGSSYPEKLGGRDYKQPNHCDGVILQPSLTAFGNTIDEILLEGRYQPKRNVPPSPTISADTAALLK